MARKTTKTRTSTTTTSAGMTAVANGACEPCTTRTRPLSATRARAMMSRVPGWRLSRGKLRRTVRFDDFLGLIEFVNEMADAAEEMQHHPDFKVSWTRLDIEIFTHAIKGLSENDFALAERIDVLLGERD